MTEHPIHELDDDVHQRVRLGILAALTGLARADFAHLKRELALTDGTSAGTSRCWATPGS